MKMLNMLKHGVLSTLGMTCLAGMVWGQTYSWKFQTTEPAGSLMYQSYQQLAETIKEVTGGEIQIEMMPVGSIVKHTETLEAVGAGVLDGHVASVEYFTGLDPAFGLLGNPSGAWGSPNEFSLFFYYGGGLDLLNELYAPYNVHALGVITSGLEAFVSKRKLNGIQDLKGLKMRAPEGMVSSVFARAGAKPVNLPTSEVYTSLDKGVIDAADYSTLANNESLGLHQIAPFPVYPGFHSMPTLDVSINKEIYEALPEHLKALLKVTIRDHLHYATNGLEIKDRQALQTHLARNGEYTDWSPADRAKFRGFAAAEWEAYSQRSKNASRVYQQLTNFLKENGLIQ